MLKHLKKNNKSFFLVVFASFSFYSYADSLENNFYNNHGVVGLINIPTARFYDESVHGLTLYNGNPDQKITLTASPYDWIEASFFYMNNNDIRQCRGGTDGRIFCQGFKDKGFNLKLRLKEEGKLPALALGLYDFAGTGIYSSEYIVASHGFNNIDVHFGLGWGQLDGLNDNINNPLGYIYDSFKDRPFDAGGATGGQFKPSQYFSGKTASPFYGVSYSLNKNLFIKIEKDPISTDNPFEFIKYPKRKSDFSYGFNYLINDNFSIGASYERGNYLSFKISYKNNPSTSVKKYKYQKPDIEETDDKYTKLIKNLEQNGIGVNRIIESSRSLGLELTQFIHPNLNQVEQIIAEASREAGINKSIKKDLKVADLKAVSEIDKNFEKNSTLIYQKKQKRRVDTSTQLKFRPFIASREAFFKGAFLLENDTEVILKDNLFFTTNLKYSIADNLEDLTIPPVDTFPAQVRSDVKQYLKNINKGVLLGRAQVDYHLTPYINHHFMLSGGILEDMFSGVGMEYLYFKQNTNYSFGLELFKVKKRDYNWRGGHLEYENTTFTANFYIRNYGKVPFDMKVSVGEYLAGDIGSTIEISREFRNGVSFGAFASFTDVSAKDFGEGSFDKGIFFNIPIYGNLIDYTWRPLTKDPGAKLIRKYTLHDLLVKFKPIE